MIAGPTKRRPIELDVLALSFKRASQFAMINNDFLRHFKNASEEKWLNQTIKPNVWGYQIQPGTRWNPGLDEDRIAEYEAWARFAFPRDFKTFLQCMNGTDISTIDVRGSSGEEQRFGVGVYSFPRDIEIVSKLIEAVRSVGPQLADTLAEQGFRLRDDAKLIPLYSHRYLVCSSDLESSAVLSIWDASDAIVYGYPLQEYLEREFLR